MADFAPGASVYKCHFMTIPVPIIYFCRNLLNIEIQTKANPKIESTVDGSHGHNVLRNVKHTAIKTVLEQEKSPVSVQKSVAAK